MCLVNTNISGLGLYSIANNISTLEGEYCVHLHSSKGSATDGRSKTGTVFWFSILFVLPNSIKWMKGGSDVEFEGGSATTSTKEEMVAVNKEVKSQVRTQYNSFGADFLPSEHVNIDEKDVTKIYNTFHHLSL